MFSLSLDTISKSELDVLGYLYIFIIIMYNIFLIYFNVTISKISKHITFLSFYINYIISRSICKDLFYKYLKKYPHYYNIFLKIFLHSCLNILFINFVY